MLDLIDQGPDIGPWVARYTAQAGQEPSGDQIGRWVAEWTRDRLGVLEAALPQQQLDSYRSLVRLVGEPVSADEARATARFMRDVTGPPSVTGPGATGLAGWPIEKVIGFLQTRPPAVTPAGKPAVIPIRTSAVTPAGTAGVTYGRTRAVTPAGTPAVTPAVPSIFDSSFDLAQELGSAVRGSPLRYSAAAGRFTGLPEPYVAHILGGLGAAAGDGADLDWDAILRLCQRVSGGKNPDTGRRVAVEPEWAGGRRDMILLLRAGLDRAPAAPDRW